MSIDYLDKETYNFDLPDSLIATDANEKRDDCRLMMLNKKSGKIEHKHFFDIIDYFSGDEVLVLNDSKVIPARIFANKKTGGSVELLLLNSMDEEKKIWDVLIKGSNIKDGDILRIEYDNNKHIYVVIENDNTSAIKKAHFSDKLTSHLLNKIGLIPLPPYIIQSRKKRGEDIYREKDREYYQNIFAKNEGSIASPTAGLHFTNELLTKLKNKGVSINFITLHVGFSTFVPIKEDNLLKHKMHKESFFINEEVANNIINAKKEKRKIVSCGTTVTRVLESVYNNIDNSFLSLSGETDIFIYPPYKYKCVDKLITNFHTPYSTLLAMIIAFSSYEIIMNAYKNAVQHEYNFFSYGDSMFIH